MTTMDLSIILVHYETIDKTIATIHSIKSTIHKYQYEIIVVDNSAKNMLAADMSDKYVKTDNNGFANACNIGARVAAGNYILFMNTDVKLGENAVDAAMDYIKQDDNIGILGIRTLLPDGTLDAGCKRGFPTPFAAFCYITKLDRLFPGNKYIGRYHMTYLDPLKTQEVECVSGAFMLMSSSLFKELGGWDERFFMYSEDIDLCMRAHEHGRKNIFFADGCITHYKGGSITKSNNQILTDCFYDGMKLFYDKHYKGKYPCVATWFVYAAIKIKKNLFKLRARVLR